MSWGTQYDDAFWLQCVRRASRAKELAREAEVMLLYLEAFPLGRHNRQAAEMVEGVIARLPEQPRRKHIQQRLRGVRDPWMPPIEIHDRV